MRSGSYIMPGLRESGQPGFCVESISKLPNLATLGNTGLHEGPQKANFCRSLDYEYRNPA